MAPSVSNFFSPNRAVTNLIYSTEETYAPPIPARERWWDGRGRTDSPSLTCPVSQYLSSIQNVYSLTVFSHRKPLVDLKQDVKFVHIFARNFENKVRETSPFHLSSPLQKDVKRPFRSVPPLFALGILSLFSLLWRRGRFY